MSRELLGDRCSLGVTAAKWACVCIMLVFLWVLAFSCMGLGLDYVVDMLSWQQQKDRGEVLCRLPNGTQIYVVIYNNIRLSIFLPCAAVVISCIAGAYWERRVGRSVGAGLMVVWAVLILMFLLLGFSSVVGLNLVSDHPPLAK